MLLARERVSAVRAIERLAGLQAQQARPPFVALWSRLEKFRREELAKVIASREVVRATMQRGTLHLASARDYLRLRGALQPGLTQGLRAILRARADALDFAAIAREARSFFGRQPRPFDEFRDHLAARGSADDVRAHAYAARLTVPLVQVPDDSAWCYPAAAAFALADGWLGKPPSTDEDARELVRGYLAAFGPASVADAQAWAGVGGLAPTFERLRPGLRTFRDEKRRELFDLPDAPRPDEATPAPARFVPEFDNLVLAWTDRSRLMTEEHRKRIVTKNLQVLATLLVDGRVAGTWTIERAAKAATLVIAPFGPLPAVVRRELESEGAALLAFSEPEAGRRELRFEKPR
ncbi:MAG TPA: winged helix DNA-binding domain-containing protein [Candidatus Acidoferrales bacterium]|nr:winged helix DNA-binding domain-containing protein [Candidatus Acidoferrales bacterium]